MNNFKEYFIEAFRRYLQTIYLPISITVMVFIFHFTGGLLPSYGLWKTIKIVWSNYYYSGSVLGFPAWGCHLIVFGLCFLSVLEFNPKR